MYIYSDNQIIEKLRAIGCDVDAALERTQGSADFFVELLHLLLEQDAMSKLAAAIADGNAEFARAEAHQLKGALGNLGLTPMYMIACSMMEPLRRGSLEGVRELHAKLAAGYQELGGIAG